MTPPGDLTEPMVATCDVAVGRTVTAPSTVIQRRFTGLVSLVTVLEGVPHPRPMDGTPLSATKTRADRAMPSSTSPADPAWRKEDGA